MFGGLQTMWVIVMFDLPTDDKYMRKDYTRFRKFLLEDGFIMMQYSVYMRHSSSEENAQDTRVESNSTCHLMER